MELNLASTCDVLVLGSGIAGISAALTAAESGASVILVCKGRLFPAPASTPGPGAWVWWDPQTKRMRPT
ncbi:MAG: FAD-dependent oxidoreductase [Flavonifractor plautii]